MEEERRAEEVGLPAGEAAGGAADAGTGGMRGAEQPGEEPRRRSEPQVRPGAGTTISTAGAEMEGMTSGPDAPLPGAEGAQRAQAGRAGQEGEEGQRPARPGQETPGHGGVNEEARAKTDYGSEVEQA